ncbi:MAG TPA: hypothetical protein VH372_25800 [Actinospica sp.]|jgi:hypothetical protein|nr:hypothetical protein [Actinospica sp.]
MSGDRLAAVAAMGAFHGLNPAMGWLFAVAIGLAERSLRALLRALPPIALGHALSIGVVALVVAGTDSVAASRLVAIGGGLVMVGFGLWRMFSKRHLRWAGMRLNARQLTAWSFLMSSVDGAGLMLLPLLVVHGAAAGSGTSSMPGMPGMAGSSPPTDHATVVFGALTNAGAVTLVHTLAMITVAGTLAVLVYRVLGLRVLRTAWINVGPIWACCLVGAGVMTMILAG